MLKNRTLFLATCLLASLVGATLAAQENAPFAFTTHTLENGPIRLVLAPVPLLERLGEQEPLTFTLFNSAQTEIPCLLKFSSCDTVGPITSSSEGVRSVTVPAGGQVSGQFRFILREGTYSAHYPLNVNVRFTWDGSEREIRGTRVVETRLPAPARTFETTRLRVGGVSLLRKSYRAAYSLDDRKTWVELGEHWTGSDSASRTAFYLHNVTCGGVTRPGAASHPPYVPRGGVLWVEYPVSLPEAEKITLSYGSAVREVKAPEPPTDGVTFRILAYDPAKGRETATELDAFHNLSTTWVDRDVDISTLAGRTVMLVLEIHPGPKNNTTCDGCSISGLTLRTGTGFAPKPSIDAHLRSNRFEFPLDDQTGLRACIYPGSNGLLDARIDLGQGVNEDSWVSFNGIRLRVGGQDLLAEGTVFTREPTLAWEDVAKGRLAFRCTVLQNDAEHPVTVYVYAHEGMLIFELPEDGNPPEIAGFELKEADRTAERVYFGHGYVLERPTAPFRIGGGGHSLAASFIGLDFENGMSLLIGSSASPQSMKVDPERRLYTLEVNGATRVALQPSLAGAYAAAVAYRQRCPWRVEAESTPGVIRKRGRLTFDVWGHSYKRNLDDLRKAFAYGVTDALYVKHVWQAWGYDVRLPDIWDTTSEDPARAKYGKFEDLKNLAEACAEQGVPFGLHDNYIDFYPDAEQFSYRYITFNQNGTPRRAWVNHGAQVLSYQWRPDLFKPFLERNLALNRKYLPTMDAYFVDVFTSANVFDFWESDGTFHPQAQTTRRWKECFEAIAAGLAHTRPDGTQEPGITISEAGHDALLGSISGADCQWMLPDPQAGGTWRMFTPCENWARTPWFAAVNHSNFSRHGAGYPDRYNALRMFHLHSPMSDDYISAELLGGLDLMVDASNVFPGAIRKHYLAQHVVRRLADREVTSVTFADGDIRRQCVTWDDGTRVYVNRGDKDWVLRPDVTLPKYGFAVFNGPAGDAADPKRDLVAGILLNPENPREIVEWSRRADGSFYLNGRGKTTLDVLPITPEMAEAEVLEDGRAFRCAVKWTCAGPAPKDLAIFVHMFEPRRGYGFKPTGWYDGGSCPIPTSKWGTDDHTELITDRDRVYRVPEGMRDGEYHVMVGLFDAQGDGRRYALMGEDAQETRYSVAKFQIRGGKIAGEILPVPCRESARDFQRLLANTTPLFINGVQTLGALYVQPRDGGLTLLPLPMMEEFDVAVWGPVASVTCGGDPVPFTHQRERVTFRVTARDAQRYEVEMQ